jgi:hypothetical protein
MQSVVIVTTMCDYADRSGAGPTRVRRTKGAPGVIAESLRDELLSVVGVASAEVDAEGDTPSGVRVRLLPDADAQQVGLEVQRVLASHGMRSRVASDGEALPIPTAAPPPVPPRPSAPPPVPEVAPVVADEIPAVEPAAAPPDGEPAAGSTSSPQAAPDAGGRPELASLAFEESADGVSITAVASDGRRFTRRAGAVTDEAVSEAVVAAVGALAEGKPQRLMWVHSEAIEGTQVVAVLIERSDGTRLAGASVVRAAKAYAVARATWAALRG